MLIESFHKEWRGARIYRSLHRSATRLTQSTGVVLCNPLGHEYYRTHRSCVKLADRLSLLGFPVMRFDYAGTGDSEGLSRNFNRKRLCEEIAASVGELFRSEEIESVALGGIRMGATLAALAAETIPDARYLLLWSPVESGRQYLSGLRQLHQRILSDMERFPGPRSATECDPHEFVGNFYGRDFVRELERLDTTVRATSLKAVAVVRAASEREGALVTSVRETATVTTFEGSDCGWQDHRRIEEIVVDPSAVNNLANWLLAVHA